MSETIEFDPKAEHFTPNREQEDVEEEASANLTTLSSVNFFTLHLEHHHASYLGQDDQAEKENIDDLNAPHLSDINQKVDKSPSKAKAPKSRRKVHACSLCAYRTTKKILLQRHLSVHDIDKPFKCEHCERSFRDPNQLANHTNIHMGAKPFKCTECELGFTTRGEMIRHTKYKHSNEKPHKCAHCDYASVELSKLKRHIRIHTGERPYLCPHCDYASRDTFKLKRHIRTHTGEKPYECPVCTSRFSQSNSLKSHLQIHRDTERTSTKCDLCDMDLENLFALAEHIKLKHSHSDVTSTDVSIFNITFDRQSASKQPLDTLNEEKSPNSSPVTNIFSCSECSVRFTSREALENHKVKHTGERPFQCMICGSFFGQLFALRAHLESHEKRPQSKSPLRKKETPNVEEQPSNVSSDKENSWIVAEIPSEDAKTRETFNCVFCSSKLASKPNLQRHMKKKHDFDIQIEDIDGFLRDADKPAEALNKQNVDGVVASGDVVLTPKSAVKRTKKISVAKTPRALKRIKFEHLTPATAVGTSSLGSESSPAETS